MVGNNIEHFRSAEASKSADHIGFGLSNQDMLAWQSGNVQTSRAADVATAEEQMFGNGYMFNAGDLYGSCRQDFLAGKFDTAEGETIAYKSDKLTPKDGETITLSQLLNDYQTPFMDAYETSKHLKDGEPGKSKTLEAIVDRLKACPWADQIHVRFDSTIKHPEYDELNSTIQIDPRRSPNQQIEDFAHEAYHASHQFLFNQYGGAMLDHQAYISTFLWGEVGSMVAEARVHDELNLPGDPTRFDYMNGKGIRDHIIINDYVQAHGLKGLFDFLGTAQPAGVGEKVYSQYYSQSYDAYRKGYAHIKPAAEAFIRKWVVSGHDAKDI